MLLQPTSDIPNYQPGVLENSPKMVILAELIDRSVHVGDKILIFRYSLVLYYIALCVNYMNAYMYFAVRI